MLAAITVIPASRAFWIASLNVSGTDSVDPAGDPGLDEIVVGLEVAIGTLNGEVDVEVLGRLLRPEQEGLVEHVRARGLTARDLLFRERLVVQSEHARITENIKRHKVALYSPLIKSAPSDSLVF